jgi:hypothetical protein
MKLTLADYDECVGRHLHWIEEGAWIARHHAQKMRFRPDFHTQAFDGIEAAEKALEKALALLREAKAIYLGKPTDA